MDQLKSAAKKAGILLGILYVFEAIFKTGPLFLLWPIIGGVFATYFLARQQGPIRARDGAAVGARAGVLGGIVLLVVGVPAVYALLLAIAPDQLQAEMSKLSLPLPRNLFLLIFSIAASYALGGLLLATAGGILASFVFRRGRPLPA